MSLRIRAATSGDGAAVAAIYAPFVAGSHTSFETEAPDGLEMAERIRDTQRTHPWLVLEDAGQVSGYAYASPHRSRAGYRFSCEVSVYVREGVRRRGIGRSLYRALFELLTRLGLYNAYAGIALPNDASVALHETLGFVWIGTYRGVGFKDGAWHDVGWWHLALQPRSPSPSPPIAFAALDPGEVDRLVSRRSGGPEGH